MRKWVSTRSFNRGLLGPKKVAAFAATENPFSGLAAPPSLWGGRELVVKGFVDA